MKSFFPYSTKAVYLAYLIFIISNIKIYMEISKFHEPFISFLYQRQGSSASRVIAEALLTVLSLYSFSHIIQILICKVIFVCLNETLEKQQHHPLRHRDLSKEQIEMQHRTAIEFLRGKVQCLQLLFQQSPIYVLISLF